jgi:ArsR family metal-binding transcriptional regulator
LTQLREMLSGLAGLGTLPSEQQATVEEAAEKVEDVQEAVDEAVADAGDNNGASDANELRVGNTG